jgi:hypothetical protein
MGRFDEVYMAGTEAAPQELRVHRSETCVGSVCSIHRPSDHHMRAWPQYWRSDRHMMERICPHRIGHPDPDDPNPWRDHGCDGCCSASGPLE